MFRSTCFKTKLNSVDDNVSPCFIPLFIVLLVSPTFVLVIILVVAIVISTYRIIFVAIFISIRAFTNSLRFIECKVSWKSMNLAISSSKKIYSWVFSIVYFTRCVATTVGLCLMKPHWHSPTSCLHRLLNASALVSLLFYKLLLIALRLCNFCNLHDLISYCFHSFGIFSSLYMAPINSYIWLCSLFPSYFLCPAFTP